MKKLLYIALLSTFFCYESLASDELTALKKQLQELSQKVKDIESKQNVNIEIAKAEGAAAARHEIAQQKKAEALTVSKEEHPTRKTPAVPPGYTYIAGNTSFQLDGFVKADAQYDAGQQTPEYYDPHQLQLPSVSGSAFKRGNTRITARMSRLGLKTLSYTPVGDVKTRIEMDFYGGQSSGTGSSTGLYNNGSTSTTYHVRLRHAYGEFKNVLAGQTDSNFYDMNALGHWLDLNGLIGGTLRIPQIRYTHALSHGFEIAVSAEQPDTDIEGTSPGSLKGNATVPGPTVANAAPGASTADRKNSYPDVTARVTWANQFGHVSLRGLIRTLGVQYQGDLSNQASDIKPNNMSKQKTVTSFGLSGKIYVWNKNNFYAQYNWGNGIGKYIQEVKGFSAIYTRPQVWNGTNAFDTIKAHQIMAGYEHHWTDKIKTNIGASAVFIHLPHSAASNADYDKRLDKYLGNVIWSPAKQFDVGLEYAYLVRKTQPFQSTGSTYDSKQATGQRYMLSLIYKLK